MTNISDFFHTGGHLEFLAENKIIYLNVLKKNLNHKYFFFFIKEKLFFVFLNVFSPLDLRSNGLMVSCFVRRPPSAVRRAPFTSYLRNPSVNFSVIWYGDTLGQYPEVFFSFS